LRSLGARIGQGCVIDTNNINEPDLISIGHSVLVAEDAFVSAATIVPRGFVDENGEQFLWITLTACLQAVPLTMQRPAGAANGCEEHALNTQR
jgi:hypothetical protein